MYVLFYHQKLKGGIFRSDGRSRLESNYRVQSTAVPRSEGNDREKGGAQDILISANIGLSVHPISEWIYLVSLTLHKSQGSFLSNHSWWQSLLRSVYRITYSAGRHQLLIPLVLLLLDML